MKTSSQLHTVDLIRRDYNPTELVARSGDRVRICNRDTFQHRPMTLDRYHRFQVILKPGQCHVIRLQNPYPSRSQLKLYDSIHSQERMVIHIESASSWIGPREKPWTPRPRPLWIVYVDENRKLCCAADEWNHYPHKRKGELPLQLLINTDDRVDRRHARILKDRFETRHKAVDWVCRHRIVPGGRWNRNYARIGGVLVGNTPCRSR